MNDTLILIPARAGSTRVKDKNKKEIAGIPLVAHIIKTALESNCGRVVVSTDSQDLKDIALEYGAEVPFLRPEEFSTSTATSLSPILHALKWFKENENWIPRYIMFVPPTSVFTSIKTLVENKQVLINAPKEINSSVTVCEPRTHPFSIVLVDKETNVMRDDKVFVKDKNSVGVVRSQDYPKVYELCGCSTSTKTTFFINMLKEINWDISKIKHVTVLDNYNCVANIIPQIEAMDINEPEDFELAKVLLEEIIEKDRLHFTYKKFMKINNKISLRALEETDVLDVLAYSKNKEFTKHLNFSDNPTLENTLAFIKSTNVDIKNQTRLYWGIQIENKIVGTIGFLNIKGKEAELGFGISPEFWGKGIVNQCMSFLIHLGFNQIKLEKLIVGTINENIRTIEFSKKEGFIFEYKTKTHTYLYLDKYQYIQKFYK